MDKPNSILKTTQQFIKYGIVGVINTLITLSVIFLLMNGFDVNYLISNIVGYMLGFINSFILNKLWTFKSKGKLKNELFLFIIAFLVCYGAQLLFLIFLIEGLDFSAEISQIIAMAFYTILNFLGNKYFTFKQGV